MSHSLSHPLPHYIQLQITPSAFQQMFIFHPVIFPNFYAYPIFFSLFPLTLSLSLPPRFSRESLLLLFSLFPRSDLNNFHSSFLDISLASIPPTSDPSIPHDNSSPIPTIITTHFQRFCSHRN